jgi:hypothetical protein
MGKGALLKLYTRLARLKEKTNKRTIGKSLKSGMIFK